VPEIAVRCYFALIALNVKCASLLILAVKNTKHIACLQEKMNVFDVFVIADRVSGGFVQAGRRFGLSRIMP